MCDTLVALPDSTRQKVTLFAKNSDRERTEAQLIESFPAADHEPQARMTCTYLTIPQVRHTHAVLISRPFWMWGAEMGANEKGVVIGNEAVFARTPPQKEAALLGMDLVRLSLERASTAAEAMHVIIELLERHGQGGNCGFQIESFYDNGFLIADATEAYILETLGQEWVAERVRSVRAISNCFSIGQDPMRVSQGLDDLIRTNAWATAVIDYAEAIADRTCDASGRRRCARSTSLLARSGGDLTIADMITILRDHGPEAKADVSWRPQHSANRTVCMHATDSEPRGQTVGSLVSEISQARAVHWVTGTAGPCTSIFKPVLPGIPIPYTANIWSEHESVHHALTRGHNIDVVAMYAERDALEAYFRQRIALSLDGDPRYQERVVVECWQDAAEAEHRWRSSLEATTSGYTKSGQR